MIILIGFIGSTILMFISFMFIPNIYLSILAAILFFLAINAWSYWINERKEQKLRKANMNEIAQMTGETFEEYLKALLKKLGYSVQLTNSTGDFGADLILTKQGNKTVVQAKRYKDSVGIKAVQEVIGAKSYYSASDAWVITNSYYTKAAKELAEKANVRLLNRNDLVSMALEVGTVLDAQDKQTAPSTPQRTLMELEQAKICPICSNDMKLRTSKHGDFYGCVTFPKCRGTLPVGSR